MSQSARSTNLFAARGLWHKVVRLYRIHRNCVYLPGRVIPVSPSISWELNDELGLGRSTARALAENDAKKVYILGRNSKSFKMLSKNLHLMKQDEYMQSPF